jgi:hypothetical protein
MALAVGVAALVGTLAGCGQTGGANPRAIGHPVPSASTVEGRQTRNPGRFAPPARFESLPAGWRQFNDGGAMLTARGAVSETIATSWRFERSSPRGPAGELPPGGVIVQVQLIRRAAGGRRSPGLCRGALRVHSHPRIRHLPLERPSAPSGGLEGNDAVPEYRIFAALHNDYHVEVRIDINDETPGNGLLREAQTVLNRLHFPNWPNHCE